MTDGLVVGRFRIRGLLGSGGTAAVFAADDELGGRRVALKLLHPHLAVDPQTWDAFFEEVRAAQSIIHPGLAEIYDAGVEDGPEPVVWISMELVTGITLAEQVRQEGPLRPHVVGILATAVLDALAAAHAGGVVHRDVTPSNIMFDPATLAEDERVLAAGVRLLDFGLADVPGRTTRGADPLLAAGGEGVVASVPYASPEQLRGAAVTEASDLYQTGATLFFALTGRPPFLGTDADVVRAHLGSPPPLPSAGRAGVPRAWDALVTTAMLKDPADRYRDAAAMARAVPAVGRPAAPAAPATTTGVTRPYRTQLPAEPARSVVAATPLQPSSGLWRLAAAAAAIAVVTGIVALSAAAGSAPSAVPTASASIAVVTPTAAPTPSAPPSAAPVSTAVPALEGLPLADATAQLTARGLLLGPVTRVDGTAVLDTVLGSDPSAGQAVAGGTAVALQVASGRNAVPAVVGLSQADATAQLTAAGFGVAVSLVAAAPPGVVSGVSPEAAASMPLGSVVTIRVGRAADPTPTPTTSATVSPTPTATP